MQSGRKRGQELPIAVENQTGTLLRTSVQYPAPGGGVRMREGDGRQYLRVASNPSEDCPVRDRLCDLNGNAMHYLQFQEVSLKLQRPLKHEGLRIPPGDDIQDQSNWRRHVRIQLQLKQHLLADRRDPNLRCHRLKCVRFPYTVVW